MQLRSRRLERPKSRSQAGRQAGRQAVRQLAGKEATQGNKSKVISSAERKRIKGQASIVGKCVLEGYFVS